MVVSLWHRVMGEICGICRFGHIFGEHTAGASDFVCLSDSSVK